ncbi:MAG: ATP-dependent acyl-CoA ligase [Chloroflexota bacterium]|nr:MAG: ATP-dependent acyl-CoA ligase [Chloroflexota bacterium]
MKTSLAYPGLVKVVPGFNYITVPELLRQKATECGDMPYILFEDDSWTFRQVFESANRIANGLISLGVKKGDRVAVILPNCPEHVFAFFGVVTSGAVELPVNIDFRGKELAYVLEHAETNVIITKTDLLPHILEVWKLGPGRSIVCIGGSDVQGVISYDDFVEKSSLRYPNVALDVDDPAGLIYTSGSTGFPKGALISHRYKVVFGAITDWSYRLSPRDRIMLITPLFHGVALWHGIMGALYMGLPCAVISRFSATNFWEQARRYQATIVYAVGAIPAMLFNQPPDPRDRDHSVRMIWAFMTPGRILEAFEKRFNTTIYDGLGQTECGRVYINYPPIRKPGSLGLPYEFSDTKIVDDDDNEVPLGEVGEICVRAPSIMLGYFKNPEATEQALKGGWLHTGDNGRMDEDGFVWFTDRKKDVIRRRGKVISSFEVQDIIGAHPKVLEAACIAVPSDLAEEEILAAVVLRPGVIPPEPEELVAWCKERLAYYKVPRYWIYRDRLPKTPSLRIQKFILRQEIKVDDAVEIPVTKEGEEIRRRVKA